MRHDSHHRLAPNHAASLILSTTSNLIKVIKNGDSPNQDGEYVSTPDDNKARHYG